MDLSHCSSQLGKLCFIYFLLAYIGFKWELLIMMSFKSNKTFCPDFLYIRNLCRGESRNTTKLEKEFVVIDKVKKN